MFSVDNFYEIVREHFARPNTENLLWLFTPHGSKDWHTITPLIFCDAFDHIESIHLGKIIAHDQEPLFLAVADTYRQTLQDPKKRVSFANDQTDPFYRNRSMFDIVDHLSDIEFLHLCFKFTRYPIICHSEKNSQDIARLEDNHFLTCYYWWHGMVVPDWFRHWRYNRTLQVTNKSTAPYRFLLYCRATDGTRKYRRDVLSFFKQHQDITLHNWSEKYVDSNASAEINVVDAQQSAIHIVAETLFDTDKIYLTEKVFKPMVMSQPFVLFAPPGSLQYLRDYGFKTFSSIWDESYDLEMDATKRQQMIFDVLDQLTKLNPLQFEELYAQALPIIQHNRDRFFSEEFQQQCIAEMFANFDRALTKQAELRKIEPGEPWGYYLNQLLERKIKIPEQWVKLFRDLIAFDGDMLQVTRKYPQLQKLLENN